MNILQRCHDWRHERRVKKAFARLHDLHSIGADGEHCRKAFEAFAELCALRSPTQVERMEKARGLVT